MPTIFVTGAGRGLGLEFVRQYAQAGWRVIGTVRGAAAAAELAALSAEAMTVDVSDMNEIKTLRSRLASERIDLLVCSAGISGRRGMALGSFDYAEWEKVLRVNLLGTAAVIEALVENVAASERRKIAVMSSRLGSISETRGMTLPYATSKAALNLLARGLAVQLAPRGILVVALHPGWVRTDMGGPAAPLAPEQSVRGLRTLLERVRPEDSGKFFAYDGSVVPW
jgi:NAD(P)-dependent dehydrogenase (short-subunit alcohol dehydrogenase family)